jgi:hypothetical protein
MKGRSQARRGTSVGLTGCTCGLLLHSLLRNLCDLCALCGETQFGRNGLPQRTQRARRQHGFQLREGCAAWFTWQPQRWGLLQKACLLCDLCALCGETQFVASEDENPRRARRDHRRGCRGWGENSGATAGVRWGVIADNTAPAAISTISFSSAFSARSAVKGGISAKRNDE